MTGQPPDIDFDPVAVALRSRQSVIPMGRNKRPLVKWQQYQTEWTAPAVVRSWLQEFGRQIGGWARITGERSRVVVLDFDKEAVPLMERLGLRPHVRTGSGGYHWIGKHPGWRVKTINSKSGKEHWRQYPNVDIRADGGYSLIAGYNEKGGYTWLRDPEPDPLDLLPQAVLEFFGLDRPRAKEPARSKKAKAPSNRAGTARPVAGVDFTDDQESIIGELLERALGKVRSGYGRNESGFGLALQLRDHEFSEEEALAVGLRYVDRVPGTNAKGDPEEYTMGEFAESLKSALTQPPREPYLFSNVEIDLDWGTGMEQERGAKPAPDDEEAFICPCCGVVGTLDDQLLTDEWVYCCIFCQGQKTAEDGQKKSQEERQQEPAAEEQQKPPDGWPGALAEEALYGLAGEVIRRIAPHTEADPAAMLVQLLSAWGNAVGLRPHMVADGASHRLRIFCAIVGTTNGGRKGTGWAQVRRFMERVEPVWSAGQEGGMSSGEGLIHAVRDSQGTDPGVIDKRKLILETEFASVLKAPKREGNNLSEQIRQAWESDNLQKMTRRNPLRATGAHIGIVGHITPDELRGTLVEVEKSNGFANRFLFVCSKRARLLPRGGGSINYGDLQERVQKALMVAGKVGEIRFGHGAGIVWDALYADLTSDLAGMLGSVTARRAPQVLRLAATYAALDGSAEMTVPHLLAAVAVWDYCAASAAYIFGDTTGDELADRIMAELRQTPQGRTKTELVDLFGRNVAGRQIDVALELLQRFGCVRPVKRESAGKGRPPVVWSATGKGLGVKPLLPLARKAAEAL